MIFVAAVCGLTAAVMFAVAGGRLNAGAAIDAVAAAAFALLQALAAVFALAEVLR